MGRSRISSWSTGGAGSSRLALAAAHDLGLHDLPIVALAKERETAIGENLVDRVYLPGQKNPIPLASSTTSLFFLLARLRDEAHRFSRPRADACRQEDGASVRPSTM